MGRLRGLDPIPSRVPPATWYKRPAEVCNAINKNGRRCLKAARPQSAYCATHGEH